MNAFDIVLVVVFVAVCGFSIYRGLLRQLMTLAVLYLTTIVAGMLYSPLVLLFQAILQASRLANLVSFWLIVIVIVFVLELVLRRNFPETKLTRLGLLDNLLGLIGGIPSALIVTSLLLTSLGYAFHAQAPLFGQVLIPFYKFYMVTHGLWFNPPPPLLNYALLLGG